MGKIDTSEYKHQDYWYPNKGYGNDRKNETTEGLDPALKINETLDMWQNSSSGSFKMVAKWKSGVGAKPTYSNLGWWEKKYNEFMKLFEEQKTEFLSDGILFSGGGWMPNEEQIGQIMGFHTFISTSFRISVAESFTRGHRNGCMIIFLVPKGFKMGIKPKYNRFHNAYGPKQEKEYILHPDAKWRVLDVDKEQRTALVELI